MHRIARCRALSARASLFSITLRATVVAAAGVTTANAAVNCDPDGLQDSGSVYRICMPAPEDYNNRLVLWAHGFQDATEEVGIPEDQLCLGDVCLPELFTSLGYAFATNSYSKTGLAIVQGKADILDLIDIFGEQKGVPEAVYLTGASEGGIITALIAEKNAEAIDGGLSACGPIGDFARQLEYFGGARLLFEVLWPGLLPGGPFNEPDEIVQTWPAYFDAVVQPAILASPVRLREWIAAARLPIDPEDFTGSATTSAEAVLRYSVVNVADAQETLGGFPFGNTDTVYEGVLFTDYINATVQRVTADEAALQEIDANYETSGVLGTPLISIHTRLDEQVPYFHQQAYLDKTRDSGSFIRDYFHIPFDRYGHCNFTPGEALLSFALMLLYAGDLFELQGVGDLLAEADLARFEALAERYAVPYRLEGPPRAIVP